MSLTVRENLPNKATFSKMLETFLALAGTSWSGTGTERAERLGVGSEHLCGQVAVMSSLCTSVAHRFMSPSILHKL